MQGLVAMDWEVSTVYEVGDQVDNNSLTYTCTTGGTSASSGGPTGTGTGITDGSCVWSYLGVTDMVLQNVNLASGQQVTITTFTRTAGGA
jgi:hypothetical protein